MRRHLSLLVGIAAIASAALGQQNLERFERTLEQIQRDSAARRDENIPLGQRALIDYGAYLSLSYFSIDDRNHDNHILRQYELYPYARVNLDGAQEFFFRGRLGYRDFNDRDSFDGRGDEVIDPDLDRGYYRFDLSRYQASTRGTQPANYNIIFEAGRDLAYWGNGLVLAQTLDGVFLNLSANGVELDLIAGITPTRTIDFDASRPSFDYDTRRGFFGGVLSARVGAHGRLSICFRRSITIMMIGSQVATGDRLNPIITRFGYDSYYLGMGSTGALNDRLTYGVEFVLEGGRALSNSFELMGRSDTSSGVPNPVAQREEWIRALAADMRCDYLLTDLRRTRLSAELILASGDQDRQSTSETFGGNRPGTDDHAFNAFGLLNTGLAFAPQVRNLVAMRVGASTFPIQAAGPLQRLQVGTDLFVFAKLARGAAIDEPSTDHRYLGAEPDFFFNWQVTNDVSFTARYAVFFPGSGVVADDHPRQVFYLGVTYAF